MSVRSSIRQPRGSHIVASPQQFITKQIQNNSNKKKFFNHRESIFRELILTQDIVESTLNKTLRDKSRFQMQKKKLRFNRSKQQMISQQNKITLIEQQKYNRGLKLNKNFSNKFRQIGHISRYFQKVCENKEQDKELRCTPFQSLDITLPIDNHLDRPDQFTSKEKEQLIQMKNNIREWKQKIKQGRNHIKTRQRCYPRIKLSKIHTKPNQEPAQAVQSAQSAQAAQSKESLSFRALREAYFGSVRQQRKTVPVIVNNDIENLLVEKRQKRMFLEYNDRFERQQSVRLKQFIQGGQPSSYTQFSDHLSISQFQQARQKFKTLSKMYNNIKEHNIYELKDMSIDNFDRNSMLALVYFIEKRSNLTQVQKKEFKKKLHLID